jgi:membrane protein implicated in regulation of membrane protease activity
LEVVGMIATDPLSLVFLGCILFSGAFLLVSLIGGIGHLHIFHLGHAGPIAHVGQVGHVGHVGDMGHVTHVSHVAHVGDTGQVAHTAPASHAAGPTPADTAASPPAAPWSSVGDTLLASLNVFGVLTFLFFFGLVGYLLHNATNLGYVFTILLPAIVGGAIAITVGAVVGRLFASTSGVLTAEDSRLEGQLGRVSRAIRPGGVGEVIFRGVVGARQSIGARDLDGGTIPPDTEIVIVAVRDGIAEVQTWDAFMRTARAGQPQLGQPQLGQPRAGRPTDVAP